MSKTTVGLSVALALVLFAGALREGAQSRQIASLQAYAESTASVAQQKDSARAAVSDSAAKLVARVVPILKAARRTASSDSAALVATQDSLAAARSTQDSIANYQAQLAQHTALEADLRSQIAATGRLYAAEHWRADSLDQLAQGLAQDVLRLNARIQALPKPAPKWFRVSTEVVKLALVYEAGRKGLP